MLKFLHVGCGSKYKSKTTIGFNTDLWQEIRLDIDVNMKPDIVGTITDMTSVESSSVDAVFSSNNIEHVYAHEVPSALSEFLRVLKSGGFLVLTCPDLQSVCALVAEDKLVEPIYVSPSGPVAPLDVLYGHRLLLSRGRLYMAHRCGFTQRVLTDHLRACGFSAVMCKRRGGTFHELWAVATKSPESEIKLQQLTAEHFPF
ncbi:MAG: class I SAM-dependent methyltransferase [Desulfomicrobium sp.]|nr:class I SAM-dependent methyltransferase [Pseudomonadota bacterium]MBV1710476.1 class I SAM-dependent methyltransferase [Desulfomicrobium sp.]MBU4570084.1 class I SAM-dependent methyltransferase [Pseudomonadota bacterium]MBU4593003.1 class I SAM-dependent methyltransferase [Pseudomonadota bacterium]MBV1720653.1 class I SAM-dependent methyltransferase [Desulfomicrobium sp.]